MDMNSIESLLNGTLDDLADKPSWSVFPTGAHLCTLSMELKTVEVAVKDQAGNATASKVKATAVKVSFKAIQTLELKNPSEDKPLNAGDANSVDLFFNHPSEVLSKNGQGTFKMIAGVLNERFGLRSNMDVINQTKDIEVVLACVKRVYKDKSTGELRESMNIEQIALA